MRLSHRISKRVSIFLSVLLIGLAPLHALQIIPTFHLHTLKKGKQIQTSLTLTNTDKGAIRVSPEAKPWVMSQENRKIPVTEFLEVDSTPFVLEEGESKTVQFVIKAPKKVKGELAGMVSLHTVNELNPSLNFRLSSAVYLAIKGTEKPGGEILDFEVLPEEKNLGIKFNLKNTGNLHIRPRGLVEFFDKEGKNVANVKVTNGGPVHPEKVKDYTGTSGFTLAPGDYRAKVFLRDVDRMNDLEAVEYRVVLKKNGKIKVKKQKRK